MTQAAEILARLEAAGLSLRVESGKLIARPKGAVTDELRGLMRGYKAELLIELEARGDAEPRLSPGSGYDCGGCDNLEMREQPQPGIRRRFFWRCKRGHVLLEARNYGSRITLAPPECEEAGSFESWKPGTQ